MEGNLSAGSMMPGASYGVLDLQGSIHAHHQNPHTLHQQQQQQQQQLSHPHQGSMLHPPMNDVFPHTVGNMHECDQSISLVDYNKGDKGKGSTSEEDEPSLTEDGVDGHAEPGKGKKGSPWHRMKWTDSMVRLLITIVSYIGEDAASECGNGGRRKFTILQKKGKWKLVSKVMAERGCYVSPQQCEDKFNDLNKRYKRLTDLLGRGTSCRVVENPALLDMMDISEKAKDDVRKILSSKHLFYEEMCSYHNGNRLHLPADPAVQRSLQLALRSKDDHAIHDTRRHLQDEVDEEDQDAETDDHDDEAEDNHALHGDNGGIFGGQGGFTKRMKHGQDHDDASFGNPSHECNKLAFSHPQTIPVDMNQVFPEGTKAAWSQKQWMKSRSLQLEEQKIQIEAQMLELERERFKWQRFSRKKDRELDKMRMENERMKLENERMALELKHRELEADFNRMP
ncbi:PREDICTED: uncharacterized protein LOC104586241 [Nelumbo nucifera]|uniref:Uncharacterized protein LOC104586241 n=1 Tax=Nelumbo nucifera TaxID=4432 RepID=A0A1U7YP04_NELNU|nr:PREDICTED: uncharacterized protein LOC104586241 [Nelumbo nucifera]XP_019056198.1 PREDICTED: uncharacterized protein LOC104586241 [Nelumbo nucifera]XP_019056199.1 PREDICTED: uncharacterized protein LOC104586241 [Nelumbo nucifera]